MRIEISFGALADEVELRGTVLSVREASTQRPRTVVIVLGIGEAERVAYVNAVLTGARDASARTHRRVPVDIDARWRWGAVRHASRIRDLSRGGAFVASRSLPDLGSLVDVEIRHGGIEQTLNFDAVVTWIRTDGDQRGFGVNFKLQNRDLAARLHDLVRTQESRS